MTYNFLVTKNDSAHRKSGHLGLDTVFTIVDWTTTSTYMYCPWYGDVLYSSGFNIRVFSICIFFVSKRVVIMNAFRYSWIIMFAVLRCCDLQGSTFISRLCPHCTLLVKQLVRIFHILLVLYIFWWRIGNVFDGRFYWDIVSGLLCMLLWCIRYIYSGTVVRVVVYRVAGFFTIGLDASRHPQSGILVNFVL